MKKEENTEKTELFTKEFISSIQDVSKQLNQIVIGIEYLSYAISKLTEPKETQRTMPSPTYIYAKVTDFERKLQLGECIGAMMKQGIKVNPELFEEYKELAKKLNL